MKRLSKFVSRSIGSAVHSVQRCCKQLGCAVGITLLILLFTGCFHKDLMTDRADDIVANLLYQGPEGNLIISKELIFQANSKSSGGGVTEISGYSEFRLSSYKIATGELAGRVELGEMIEEANALLGYSPGKIWMFSILPELGLHYRDPVTLEVKESWEQLSKKPGWADFKPARPDWPIIDQYFAFDWVQNRLLLTDETGFRYAVDPNTFVLQKVDAEMPRPDWNQSIASNNGQFQKGDRNYLEGDPRRTIATFEKKSPAELSFLFGEWIIDHNPMAEGQRKRALSEQLQASIITLKDSLARFSAAHPEADQEPDYAHWSWEQRDIHGKAETIRRAINDAERDLKSENEYHQKILDSPLLTGDRHSAYILHTNLVSDTSHAMVSRVNLRADSTWSLAWATDLYGIYHDYSKADQAGVFETVYSKGNPSFQYTWSCADGAYLVLIMQLHLLALDLKTGKLQWNIEI